MAGLIDGIGEIDILVNNAGVFQKGRVLEKSIWQLERTIDINLVTPMRLISTVLPSMVSRKECMIVNICSLTKDLPGIAMSDYCASKAGLYMYHQVLRQEIKSAGYDIHTLVVSPYVLTQGLFGGFKMPVLSRVMPGLSHEYVARETVAAMREKEEETVLPGYFRLVTLVTLLIPLPLWDYLAHLFCTYHL